MKAKEFHIDLMPHGGYRVTLLLENHDGSVFMVSEGHHSAILPSIEMAFTQGMELLVKHGVVLFVPPSEKYCQCNNQ